MQNNKGFTLVELLVAMAIMGLLIIMAFPTMRAVQTNNTKKKYQAYGDTILSAAKLYVDSYGDDLFDPDRVNQNQILYLDKLQEKDLIKDINISGSTCIADSNIKIIKYNNDYTYCLRLKCTSDGETVYDVEEKKGACEGFSTTTVYYTYNNVTRGEIEVVTGDDHYKILSPDKLTNLSRDINNNHEVFEHWKIGTNTYDSNTIYPHAITSTITFEAVTRPWKYTINYHKSDNNYSGNMDKTDCNYGQDCYLRNIGFSRTGYHFVHWKKGSTNNTYANQANVKTTIGNNISGDKEQIDLTAVFEINKVFVKLNANEGSLATNHGSAYTITDNKIKKDNKETIHTVNYGESLSNDGLLNYNNPSHLNLVRTGYSVPSGKEWNTNSSGTGTDYNQATKYTAAQLCSTIATGDCTKTLYVNWKINSYICSAGNYLKKSATSCSQCTAGHYCPGGTYNYSTSSDQGINNCPSYYGNSNAGSSAESNCYMNVSANQHVATAKAAAVDCGSGYQSLAHTVHYGSTSACTQMPAQCGHYVYPNNPHGTMYIRSEPDWDKKADGTWCGQGDNGNPATCSAVGKLRNKGDSSFKEGKNNKWLPYVICDLDDSISTKTGHPIKVMRDTSYKAYCYMAKDNRGNFAHIGKDCYFNFVKIRILISDGSTINPNFLTTTEHKVDSESDLKDMKDLETYTSGDRKYGYFYGTATYLEGISCPPTSAPCI